MLYAVLSYRPKPDLISKEESEYAASRYKPPLKSILEDLVNNELSMDDYPSIMPMPDQGLTSSVPSRGSGLLRSSRSKRGEAAGSARKKAGASDRWTKSSFSTSFRSSGPTNFTGGRCIVFTVGGIAYTELRVAREVMNQTSREIIVGSTSFISPKEFLQDLEMLGSGSD